LVQVTLGHSSVATTSNYLHARPGDSSARFLAVTSKTAASVAGQDPKDTRTATVAQQARPVASGNGKLGNKATVRQESAQAR